MMKKAFQKIMERILDSIQMGKEIKQNDKKELKPVKVSKFMFPIYKI